MWAARDKVPPARKNEGSRTAIEAAGQSGVLVVLDVLMWGAESSTGLWLVGRSLFLVQFVYRASAALRMLGAFGLAQLVIPSGKSR